MSEFTVRMGGKDIAVDDMILVKDVPCTAGSRMLEGFVPLFSAEAVERLTAKGYTLAGKTPVGEFGLDLVGELSYQAPQEGTLQHAASQAVATGQVKAALCVDMNGSPRRGAALSGVSFLKPTYGTVSRYGLVSCAASGEQLGVCAKKMEGIREMMQVIAGHDEKDGTCLRKESYDYTAKKPLRERKVAVVKELWDKAEEKVQAKLSFAKKALQEAGVQVEEISLSLFPLANTAWQILMSAETCNNVSRYDGVKYGHRAADYKDIDSLYVNSRTEGFNFLTKSVILYGSEMLSKARYGERYDKSLRVRRVMAENMKEVFSAYDAILLPPCSCSEYEAYPMEEAFLKSFAESEFTALANLIGIPALVCGGVQLMGDHFGEEALLALGEALEGKGE